MYGLYPAAVSNQEQVIVMHVSDGNRTVLSREVLGRSWDGTGQDLETLKVPWSCGPGLKKSQSPRTFLLRSPATFPG